MSTQDSRYFVTVAVFDTKTEEYYKAHAILDSTTSDVMFVHAIRDMGADIYQKCIKGKD